MADFCKTWYELYDSGRHLVSVLLISHISANNMAESGTCIAGATLAPLNFYVVCGDSRGIIMRICKVIFFCRIKLDLSFMAINNKSLQLDRQS